jgi:hypothetical protein
MKLQSWCAAALAVCAVASAPRLQAKQAAMGGDSSTSSNMEADLQPMDQSEFDSYDSYDTYSTGGGYSSGGGGLGGMMSRPIQLVVGAEYLYAKANFSDALAFVEQDLVNGGETWRCYDFDYSSSYSFYAGVYLPDCGGSLIFDYTRLTSDAEIAANSVVNQIDIFGPFEADDNVRGEADVDLNSYDVSVGKTIPLGCALECGGGGCDDACCEDVCCDSGCGGWCPAWDITWTGGVRFADVEWARSLDSFDPLNNNAFLDGYETRLDFQGFGGRVGLMGRRYIGRRGLASLYAKGDMSILFGDVEIETLVTNAAGTAFHRKDCEQVIPVTEIELGGSVHLGSHATLSAGYFWSAWHDLGMGETYDFNGRFQLGHYDDANILGFDGLFARVEAAF